MTTLISWIGVDSRGITAAYLASDSRISWGQSDTWDNGRKVFSSKTRPEIFGYSGDVLFPVQVLGQLIEQIDQAILFAQGEDFAERASIIQRELGRSFDAIPSNQRRSFQVIYASRDLEGMESNFHVCRISWNSAEGWSLVHLELPNHSGLVEGIGTGSGSNAEWYRRWQQSDVGRTSRSVFGAFCNSLRSGKDPFSGGPPQLVGIYRAGPARSFGLIMDGKRYLNGQVVPDTGKFDSIEWRNELFERCDGDTLKLIEGAQSQPNPLFREM